MGKKVEVNLTITEIKLILDMMGEWKPRSTDEMRVMDLLFDRIACEIEDSED